MQSQNNTFLKEFFPGKELELAWVNAGVSHAIPKCNSIHSKSRNNPNLRAKYK